MIARPFLKFRERQLQGPLLFRWRHMSGSSALHIASAPKWWRRGRLTGLSRPLFRKPLQSDSDSGGSEGSLGRKSDSSN